MINQPGATEGAPKPLGMKDLLKIRDFRLIWLGQLISDFGDSLTNLALLILITNLTGSTAALATMLIVLTIPQITFGLIAGVYVDRLDRKQIMILSDTLRGLLVLGFILVGSVDQLWLLYLIGFVQASIGTLFTPARGAMLPNIVPAHGLMVANSAMQTARIVMGVLGAAAASLIIGLTNSYWAVFTIDAATFFASVLLVIGIRAKSKAGSSDKAASAKAIFGELAEGLRIIKDNSLLTGTLVALAVAMLGIGAINVLFVPLVVNVLNVSVTWLGALQFVQTLSMILSAGLVAWLAARFKPAGIVSSSLFLMGILLGLIFFVPNVWYLLPILFAFGWIMTPFQASVSTIIQTSVEDRARGRISASLNTIISTASLLSMAMAGVFGEALGVRNVFVLGGLISVVAAIGSAWVFRSYSKGTTPPSMAEARAAQPSLAEVSPS